MLHIISELVNFLKEIYLPQLRNLVDKFAKRLSFCQMQPLASRSNTAQQPKGGEASFHFNHVARSLVGSTQKYRNCETQNRDFDLEIGIATD